MKKYIIIGVIVVVAIVISYMFQVEVKVTMPEAEALYNAKSTKLIEGIGETPDNLEMTIETKINRTQEELLEEKEKCERDIEYHQKDIARLQAEIDEINNLLKSF